MYSKMLVPIDWSKLSEKAVKEASKLGKLTGAQVMVLHVRGAYAASPSAEGAPIGSIGKRKILEDVQAASKPILDSAMKIAATIGVIAKTQLIVSTSPFEEIVKTAKKDKYDLIVMASHGRSGLGAILIGSETQKVLTHTKVPVLVVR